MKRNLKRLIVLALFVGAAWYVWSNRHYIALIENNNVRIRGDWHKVSMDFKEEETYTFAEGIVELDGFEWGTFRLRKNTELELKVDDQILNYHLEFSDDENMIWLVETKKGLVPSIRWRR
jgi:hypothetical protein